MTEEELQINIRVYNINTPEFGCGFVLMRHKAPYGIDVRYPDHAIVIPYKEEEFKNFIDEETYLKYVKK